MGRIVSEISIKYEGDLFNLCLFPYQFSEIVPTKIETVDLLSGRWGTVGSVISWTYIIGGAKSVAKEMIEGIDENRKKKSMTFKVIGGDVLNLYNEFKIIYEVKSNGEDDHVHVLSYTMEYEKKSDQVPEPTMLMDFLQRYPAQSQSQSPPPNQLAAWWTTGLYISCPHYLLLL